MSEAQDPSFLLVKILEDLDSKQNSVSYQDLCKSLCSRYELPELAKLRSLLYYTACQDPNFPASLFRDKMRNAAENQQSKKIIAAADIVTIFNLIQMNDGVAKEKLPMTQQSKQKESIELDSESYSETDSAPHKETQKRDTGRTYSITRSSSCHKEECEGRRTFLPEPNFLLGVKKEGNDRAGSLDRLQALDSYPLTSQPCEMQSTYFPSQPLSEPESLPPTPNEEPFRLSSSVGQRRNIFKDDFHNLLSISPNVTMKKGDSKMNPKTTVFFNHSFEMPYSSHYLSTAYSSSEDNRRVKHESLDDLQASTYFGPSTGVGSQDHKRFSGKPRQPMTKPVKSWSLNTEEVPDFERSFFNHRKEESLCYPTTQSGNFVSVPERHHSYLPDLALKSNGKKFCEPQDVEKQEALRRFRDKSTKQTSCQYSIDKTESVGTQTEQAEAKKVKESNVPSSCNRYGEGRARNQSEADSEIISDDISDIFRFLDDMSLCGSSGIPQSSCYNSSGSLAQALRTDHESSPEHGLNKTNNKPTKGPRSEIGEEEELKSSVRKLVMRIGEIEKKLESLSGVREEVSQVLAKLNKLDERMQPGTEKGKGDPESQSHSIDSISNARASPSSFQDPNTCHNGKLDSKPECCCSEVNNGTTESLRVKALKKNLFTQRSVRSLNEEISISEHKISSSPHDGKPWGYSKQSSITEDEKKEKGGSSSRDWHRKSKEVDRPHELPHLHRIPKPHKETFMVEQVFSPHPYPASLKAHMKSNPIYTDMRLTEMAELKRTQPSWTIEEYTQNSGEKGRLTALDLQTQESLNPNNLEFWMEDIYTPGYDSLLKRKEAEFRRAKVCKMAALITAAACTVILVIVVPICTMKS
ncbi:major intrinsically disordered Notch2-binding receptor 1 [Discoglossus pictus]